MRVCHLSWEYPPVVYGGLGRHVHALAEAQAALGHDVTVITDHVPHLPAEESVAGVRILRAAPAPPDLPFDTEHLLAWVLGLNHRLVTLGNAALPRLHLDVLHAHDWLVAHAARDLAAIEDTPIVATIHATEAGRHQGWLPTDLSRSIHRIESWLVESARHVITCSEYMESEVSQLFNVPNDDLTVIPNGIDTARWSATSRRGSGSGSGRQDGPTLVYCGRLEWEKGVHTLVDAVARLRREFPGLRLVIAGDGTQREALVEQSRRRRIATRVTFTGWLPEERLYEVMTSADAIVVPSIYEPFGLVALEAAALNAPLVVARTGGLAEFAADDSTAITFSPGAVDELVVAVHRILDDPRTATIRARRARRRLRDHHAWPMLADATVSVYEQAAHQRDSHRGRPTKPLPGQDLSGNLLARPPA